MEVRELFEKILREEIERLENDRVIKQKKAEKLFQKFNSADIQKLDKIAAEINNIDHTIRHLYIMIGSLDNRLK